MREISTETIYMYMYLSSGSVSGQCVSIQSILLTIVGGVTSLAKLKCTCILTCSMKYICMRLA